MRITFVLLVAAALAGLGVTRAAQQPASSASAARPSGKEVVNKVVQALGGDAFLHMESRLTTGRIYGFFHDQLSGRELVKSYTAYIAAPSPNGLAVQERQLLGKKQDYSNLFTPTAAWDITFRGARPYPDEDWERYVRTTRSDIFYILRCRLNEPGMIFDYIGNDIYVSRHVEILDITDAQNQVIRVYLDHNTMLPLHETYSWLDEKTREHNDASVDYDKYRSVGGVMWPYVVERQRNGYKVFQLFADEVQVNVKLPAGIFDLPKGAQLLKAVQ